MGTIWCDSKIRQHSNQSTAARSGTLAPASRAPGGNCRQNESNLQNDVLVYATDPGISLFQGTFRESRLFSHLYRFFHSSHIPSLAHSLTLTANASHRLYARLSGATLRPGNARSARMRWLFRIALGARWRPGGARTGNCVRTRNFVDLCFVQRTPCISLGFAVEAIFCPGRSRSETFGPNNRHRGSPNKRNEPGSSCIANSNIDRICTAANWHFLTEELSDSSYPPGTERNS